LAGAFQATSPSGAGLLLPKLAFAHRLRDAALGEIKRWGNPMAAEIKSEKQAITIDKWEVAMSEAVGGVVLLLFPTDGDVVPIILRPAQATKLGHDLQSPKFVPKPTVQ